MMCSGLATITRSPSKHCSRMNRAREICGRKVTTMTVRQPYCAAKRRSSRPSPFVVGGSGTKQCRSNPGCGVCAVFRQPWVIRPVRVRHHHVRRPALASRGRSRRVPAISGAAEDEYRVGVAQRIDLGSHVHRQPADHGGDQQQADRYHQSSDASPAARITARQCATLTSR